jgi:hypothetical protein
MDDYWSKSTNKEVAGKKLDEDMDAYWEQKKTKEPEKEEEAKETPPVEEVTTEA